MFSSAPHVLWPSLAFAALLPCGEIQRHLKQISVNQCFNMFQSNQGRKISSQKDPKIFNMDMAHVICLQICQISQLHN